MNIWIALLVVASFAVGANAIACSCETSTYAMCADAPSCAQANCHITVGNGTKQFVDCQKLIPKCFLMQAEMFSKKRGSRSGNKPHETAIVDNDGIYDPECENDGTFKAKQCNNTETCWCVNSAGVRRTDKGDRTLKCDELVMTYWVRLELTHKPVTGEVNAANLKAAVADAIHKRYKNFNKDLISAVEYKPEARMLLVDVQQPKGERKSELTHMAYYMEKDVKEQSMMKTPGTFAPKVGDQTLEMEKILVYYVDEKAPTMTMQHLSGGIIAVIVVVVVAVVAGLLILFFLKKRQDGKYGPTPQREMDNL